MSEYADLITTAEAATIIGVSPSTLRTWRNGTPRQRRLAPPSLSPLGRTVRYSRRAVEAWLEARTQATGVGGHVDVVGQPVCRHCHGTGIEPKGAA